MNIAKSHQYVLNSTYSKQGPSVKNPYSSSEVCWLDIAAPIQPDQTSTHDSQAPLFGNAMWLVFYFSLQI